MHSPSSPDRRRRLRMRAASIALALGAVGCGTSANESSPAAPASAGVEANVVPDALRFTADLLGGGTFDPAELAGGPVVLWFWAPT